MMGMSLFSKGETSPAIVGGEKSFSAEDSFRGIVPITIDKETGENAGMMLFADVFVLIGSACSCPSVLGPLDIGVVNQQGVVV